jgi:hypothetical protein
MLASIDNTLLGNWSCIYLHVTNIERSGSEQMFAIKPFIKLPKKPNLLVPTFGIWKIYQLIISNLSQFLVIPALPNVYSNPILYLLRELFNWVRSWFSNFAAIGLQFVITVNWVMGHG